MKHDKLSTETQELLISELIRLDAFSVEYKDLIIYGAGHYAEVICAYLNQNGAKIEGFCISDSKSKVTENKWGYPVFKISERIIYEDTGIILGLNEKHQAEVMENINKFDPRKVFKPTGKLIEYIKTRYAQEVFEIKSKNETIDEIIKICKDLTMNDDKKSEYDETIRDIKERYKKVTLVPAEHWIGGVLEEYACMVKFGSPNPEEYWLFIPSNPNPATENNLDHPNEFIFEKMKGDGFSSLTKGNSPFWKYFLKCNRDFFKCIGRETPWDTWLPKLNQALRNGELTGDGKTEYIRFSSEEESFGKNNLQNMGLDDKYVSMFSRDACYAKAVMGETDKYRANMDIYRNSDFATFFQAAKMLNERGIKAVRIGKKVRALELDSCIIDYANKYRSDFMDFYLAKHSYFFLGDPSGIHFFYSLFGKPFALTNYSLFVTDNDGAIPLTPERDLVIYHKFWSTKKDRYLTMSEMLDIGFSKKDGVPYCNTVSIFETYKDMGIVPISNTADEISGLSQEMIERLDGTAKYTDEDELLQEKYFEILHSYVNKFTNVSYCNARVGREFLRNNLWLTQ